MWIKRWNFPRKEKKKSSFASKYELTVSRCKTEIFVVIFRRYIHFPSSGHLSFSLSYSCSLYSLYHLLSYTFGSDNLKPGNSNWSVLQVTLPGLVSRLRSKPAYFSFLLIQLTLTQNLLPCDRLRGDFSCLLENCSSCFFFVQVKRYA